MITRPPLPEDHPLALPPRHVFARRVARFLAVALAFLILFLSVGMLGYHHFAGLGWIDSLLNAAMILTGMGPVDAMQTDAAKLFASFYALVSGAVYPVMTAVVFFPFVHRMLNILHLQALSRDIEGPDGDA